MDNVDSSAVSADAERRNPLGVFGRFLSIWVALSCAIGVIIGYFLPTVPKALEKATISHISIPVAFMIWIMVYPMIIQIDLNALRRVRINLKPVAITSMINYLVQPFTMYALSLLFFKVIFKSVINDSDLENEYLAGAVILGGSPCTAMVFVWSFLTRGDPAYTLVQVAVNDILIFVFYIPTLMLLLQVTNISVPWDTAFLSVVLFMFVPGLAAYATRAIALRYRNEQWLERLVEIFKPLTMIALLVTIVLIFIFQGGQIVDNTVHVLLIAVPLTLQSYIIFALAYFIFFKLRIPHRYAAPGALIATSNFFELAVAMAMSLFGADSGATLTTVVGVLEEVPIMLSLVWFANRTRHWFPLASDALSFLKELSLHFDAIPEKRQHLLKALAAAIQWDLDSNGKANIIFICTHNSRRSQFCEALFYAAVTYYRILHTNVYSGGTEVTNLNNRVINALQRVGFKISRVPLHKRETVMQEYDCNYRFICTPRGLKLSENHPMYSKLYTDSINPSTNLITVMVCSSADKTCPNISGASHRIFLPYDDPKFSDDMPNEQEIYEITCMTIARELLFVASILSSSAVKEDLLP